MRVVVRDQSGDEFLPVSAARGARVDKGGAGVGEGGRANGVARCPAPLVLPSGLAGEAGAADVAGEGIVTAPVCPVGAGVGVVSLLGEGASSRVAVCDRSSKSSQIAP
jgi:hypothetical protein